MFKLLAFGVSLSLFLQRILDNQQDEKAKEQAVIIPPGGEGGETGEIIPGQSIVFATLEVCMCVISQRVPALNPAAQSTGFQLPTRLSRMTEEVCQLLASVVQVMTDLPSLCSIPGNCGVFLCPLNGKGGA